jgi:very-short-patch-repair endonuclease
MLSYNKGLKPLARSLRTNMTQCEGLLWSKLRRKQLKGYQFYRQKIIGEYIVDFYCPGAELVIELDGGQHYSEAGHTKDRARDDILQETGLKVLRFSDRDVLENMPGVLERIWGCLR